MRRILKATIIIGALFGISCGKSSYVIKETGQELYHFGDSSHIPDPEAMRIIRPYKLRLDSMVSEVLAISDTEMVKGTPEGALGNFIADLVLDQSMEHYGQVIDFCVLNNGGLRSTIPKGPVTLGRIYELMPFENQAVVLKLNGITVRQLFDKIALKGGEPVAGVSFTISNGQAENIYINGSEFNMSRTYVMVTSDYLAEGGEDLFFLKDALQKQSLGIKLRDLITGFLRSEKARGASIKAAADGRIKIK